MDAPKNGPRLVFTNVEFPPLPPSPKNPSPSNSNHRATHSLSRLPVPSAPSTNSLPREPLTNRKFKRSQDDSPISEDYSISVSPQKDPSKEQEPEASPLRVASRPLLRKRSTSAPIFDMNSKDKVEVDENKINFYKHFPNEQNQRERALNLTSLEPNFQLKSPSSSKSPRRLSPSPFGHLSKKKEDKHLNKFIMSSLESDWSRSLNKSLVNSEKIENIIHSICRKHLFKLQQEKKIRSYYEFYSLASQSAPLILNSIQSCPTLLKDIRNRLKIFYQTMEEFQHKDSLLSEKLLQFLKILIKVDKLKNGIFWGELTEFRKKGDDKIVSIILKAFGDTPSEIESVLETIHSWSQTPEICSKKIPVTPQVCLKLDAHIHKACAEIQLAEKAPFVEHVFPLQPKDVECMLGIHIGEVQRCLLPEDAVLINGITINGKVFHLRGHKEFARPSQFWRALLKRIYKLLKIKVSNKEIDLQIEMYRLKTDIEFRNKHLEMIVPTDEEIEKIIPCLPILKLMTNTAWLRGDSYFKEFYTPITICPYTLKAKEGLSECSVVIDSSQHFKITHTKVYKLLDSNSQKQSLLAEIPISWTVERNRDNWGGRLQILDPKDMNKVIKITKKQMRMSGEDAANKLPGAAQIQACHKLKISPILNPEFYIFEISQNAKEEHFWQVLNTLSNHTLIQLKLYNP